jgi:hypothetical protein
MRSFVVILVFTYTFSLNSFFNFFYYVLWFYYETEVGLKLITFGSISSSPRLIFMCVRVMKEKRRGFFINFYILIWFMMIDSHKKNKQAYLPIILFISHLSVTPNVFYDQAKKCFLSQEFFSSYQNKKVYVFYARSF